MTIVAEHFTFVVGVDTHARSNTYAIIATRTAARLDAATFPASPPGISRALSWISPPTLRAGSGSFPALNQR